MAISDEKIIEVLKGLDPKNALPPKIALACTIYGEARGELIEGQVAVGCVIRNRTRQRKQDYPTVIFAPWQFSCWQKKDGLENYQRTMAAARSFVSGGGVPAAVEGGALGQCLWIAEGIVAGTILDRVKGCTNYHTKGTAPSWAAKLPLVCEVGNHLFYREG